MTYDPSEVGKKGTLFGLPYSIEEADIIVVPVPLDVTVSYQEGTSQAPQRVLEESSQLDLSLYSVDQPWLLKLALDEINEIFSKNDEVRSLAAHVIDELEQGQLVESDFYDPINSYCKRVMDVIEARCDELAEIGKTPIILGGDHSSPLGLLRSLSKKHEFGILQIDAHMDLRDSYEGFIYSHASIMRNALQEDGVISITQVGIRDFCEEETNFIKGCSKPIKTFFDEQIYRDVESGKSKISIFEEVMSTLPNKVYISFDIDGLEPSLCPNTGTPVPGGIGFNDVILLMEKLIDSGKEIIGLDVSEIGNGSWDANVGARILYRLLVSLGLSKGLLH